MLKKNRLKVVISSIIILLPMLFGIIVWNDLPDIVTTHWGADGIADGFGGKAFAVFGMPVMLLAVHFVCMLFTLLDKKQREQNPKVMGMIFWIIPIISIFANSVMYRAAFGMEIDLMSFVPVPFAVMFIVMGNYFPKIKPNRTLGIKISWTLNNEENWNKTHRFGGKVWVIGGIVMLLSAVFPVEIGIPVMLCVIVAVVIIPMVYSYLIYKRHQKEGITYTAQPKSKAEKTTVTISAVIASVILIGVAILMFTGNVEVRFEDTSFKINATYWADLEVDYSEIDTVEYRTDLDVGVRTNGLGSARLSLGNFKNEEFGPYTLYAYTSAEEFVVLTSEDGKILVIGMSNAEDTQTIYDTMLERVDK